MHELVLWSGQRQRQFLWDWRWRWGGVGWRRGARELWVQMYSEGWGDVIVDICPVDLGEVGFYNLRGSAASQRRAAVEKHSPQYELQLCTLKTFNNPLS